MEKLKVSQNFAHYENIIDDENRITSWTNLKARSGLVKSGGTPQKLESVTIMPFNFNDFHSEIVPTFK